MSEEPRLRDTPELRKAIARAVLDDLEDRRAIKRPLCEVKNSDPDIYAQIEQAIAAAVIKVLVEAEIFPPCPYAGGRWEDGVLVGRHSIDCRCNEDGLIR